ncbi:hypothetical protein Q73A0000_00200 [Kaistella flava (ex Peng et al. 2021)]|uniref:Phytase-like domain-containing protein n=1 Tax=Kaistella flava (ex Peng et al. 2021) TaxID=2038776 RepID=A0A7M2Y463_9FLAO|nr:hypothetical protein [Kaistella flava (ex Peng et al. 2021)]QOW08876.1 hypothetical protein Q73A0000_00200 [Kaistella flava (ex Peng et al. 2021)]
MEITVLNYIKVNNLPSGSGMAKYGGGYYAIGDDSPYLFFLNKKFQVISKTLISNNKDFNGERIIKAEKADFESVELINGTEMVTFGSGGKSPQRDVLVRILLHQPLEIENYDITPFYNHLRNLPEFKNSELNIEATAFYDNQLYLFNRKKSLIIKFNYTHYLSFIKGEAELPTLEIKEFFLPKIDGIESGFSGATILQKDSKIIFTASVEDSINAYEDGEILGSFIGMIDISNNTISKTYQYCAIPNNDEKFKVESVTIDEEIEVGKTKLILITDDDEGSSTIIDCVISW